MLHGRGQNVTCCCLVVPFPRVEVSRFLQCVVATPTDLHKCVPGLSRVSHACCWFRLSSASLPNCVCLHLCASAPVHVCPAGCTCVYMCVLQAAQTPPAAWLWRNVYVDMHALWFPRGQLCPLACVCPRVCMCMKCTCVYVCALQAAQTPPDAWLWRNVYVDSSNVRLRDIEGDLIQPKYDPTYSS